MAEKYDYYEAVKNDVLKYIQKNINLSKYNTPRELENYLEKKLFTDENVTGDSNPFGTGKYPLSENEAEDNLRGNLDLLGEALTYFCCSSEVLNSSGASAMDVIVRRYVLPEAVRASVREATIESSVFKEWKTETLERFEREYETEGPVAEEMNLIEEAVAWESFRDYGQRDEENTYDYFTWLINNYMIYLNIELIPKEAVSETDDELEM